VAIGLIPQREFGRRDPESAESRLEQPFSLTDVDDASGHRQCTGQGKAGTAFDGGLMHTLRVEAGIVIFLLFFGTALLDSLRHHTWLLSTLYIALGLMFVLAGRKQRSADRNSAV
jgi:hypothetical protein